jgi:hypothetical protein
MEMITASAMRCGFTGGMVVDFPNSTKVISYASLLAHHVLKFSNSPASLQAKKYFLVLMTGRPSALPRAVGEDVLSCSSGTVGTTLPARFSCNNPLTSPCLCTEFVFVLRRRRPRSRGPPPQISRRRFKTGLDPAQERTRASAGQGRRQGRHQVRYILVLL